VEVDARASKVLPELRVVVVVDQRDVQQVAALDRDERPAVLPVDVDPESRRASVRRDLGVRHPNLDINARADRRKEQKKEQQQAHFGRRRRVDGMSRPDFRPVRKTFRTRVLCAR